MHQRHRFIPRLWSGLGLAVFLFAPALLSAAPTTRTLVATVTLGGELSHPTTLDAAALAKLPHVNVQASAHGVSGTWSGVSLNTLLAAGGAPLGEALRGKNMSLYVRISGADGYHVVYALAELDPQFRSEPVILVDRHDGKPLDDKEGPFRVIAPTDLRPARWVRQVVKIELLRAPDGG
jgi:DMSO/TMAO reductase YedYZ molybdopterin-dependent catalytic subunit